jgi:hypothetical protein
MRGKVVARILEADMLLNVLTLSLALLTTTVSLVLGLGQTRATKQAAELQFNLGISQLRQQWINSLRELISSFLTDVTMMATGKYLNDPTIVQAEKRSEAACLLHTRISLMINRNEADHFSLVSKLHGLLDQIMKPDVDRESVERLIKESQELSQNILKREWDRLKHGK